MLPNQPFTVVIVGSSVAGLSLANMLQANDIDFVVLEAHPTVAPQVGASIGLLPHGNLILDQLELYNKVVNVAPPVKTFNFRDTNGSILGQHHDMDDRLIERHGYPMIFLDRQKLLQILYNNIKDKSRILTAKRVIRTQLIDGGVEVIASDGTKISGDILVGADGIHSTIRQEMWRLARGASPNHFDPYEHEAPPCDNSCIFGISNPCQGIGPGDLHCVFRDNSSYLVTGGPEGRIYWFRFQRLPKTLRGSDIPRYSQDDLSKALADAADDHILPGVKFSALVDNKVSAVMTPLVEYVYKQWHFDRIITLGDSAHKFHPVGGLGGNAAMESAALLTNNLVKALRESTSGRLSSTQVEQLFSNVQTQRKPRLALNHRYSNGRARTEALVSPLKKFMSLYLIPLVDEQAVTLGYCSQHPGGERLDMIPVRRRENLISYKQDLLSEPKSRGCFHWLLSALYLVLAAFAIYAGPKGISGFEPLGSSSNNSSMLESNLTTGTSTTKIAPIKLGIPTWLSNLDSLQLYTLGHLIQPTAIIAIEGYRGRNKLTPLGLPVLWLMLVHKMGLGIAMPIYFAMYTLVSDAESYWWPLRRFLPLNYARSILPASVIGEAVRVGLLYEQSAKTPSTEVPGGAQAMSFLLVPSLLQIFGSFGNRQSQQNSNGTVGLEIRTLRQAYLAVGLVGVVCHWYVVVSFFKNMDPIEIAALLSQSIAAPGTASLCAYCTATYVWIVQAVWDLRRVGRTNLRVFTSTIGLLLILIALGPGASMAFICFHREKVMSRTHFERSSKRTSKPRCSRS